ncbi:MAG TPA: hypothetical protein VFK41_03920 [Nocardioidaceae bacterium]|nr:hypothetical protein [Nocardioidaceae bacterium]
MTRSRILVPLAAALAVMVLTGGIWWATAGSDEGGNEAQPRSSGPALDEPGDEPAGGGSSGNSGTGTTDPGSGKPVEPTPGEQPAPGSVRVDSYVKRTGTSLALNYTIGVPECYGRVTGVDVRETPEAVFVRLVHELPDGNDDKACIDIAMLKSIDVQLASPLADRTVKDEAFEGGKVVEAANAAYEDGGY